MMATRVAMVKVAMAMAIAKVITLVNGGHGGGEAMAMMVMKVTLATTAMMVVTREILKRGKQWKQQFWGQQLG